MKVSCTNCRLSKKKCSRSKPVCERCIKFKLECDYKENEYNYEQEEQKRKEIDRIKMTKMSKRMKLLEIVADSLGLNKGKTNIQRRMSNAYTNGSSNTDESCFSSSPITHHYNINTYSNQISYPNPIENENNNKRNRNELIIYNNDDKRKEQKQFTTMELNIQNLKYYEMAITTYTKESLIYLNKVISLQGFTNFTNKQLNTINTTAYKDNIIETYLFPLQSFYPFLSKSILKKERYKEINIKDYTSPLILVVMLIALRHAKFIRLRDLGYISWDPKSSKVQIINSNEQDKKLIPLQKDPLYFIVCQFLNNNDNLNHTFLNQLVWIQASILLCNLEFSQGLENQLKIRFTKLVKLAQSINLHNIVNFKKVENIELVLEIQSTFDVTIMYDILFSYFHKTPTLFNTYYIEEYFKKETCIKIDFNKLNQHQFSLYKRQLLCSQLAKSYIIFKKIIYSNHQFINNQTNLNEHKTIALNHLNQLDKLYNRNEKHTILSLPQNEFPLQIYYSIIAKNMFIIFISEPLLHYKINIIQQRYYDAVNNLVYLLSNTYKDIESSKIQPLSFIKESGGWTIPFATYKILKCIININNKQFHQFINPLINLYRREVLQWPNYYNLDFSYFDNYHPD